MKIPRLTHPKLSEVDGVLVLALLESVDMLDVGTGLAPSPAV